VPDWPQVQQGSKWMQNHIQTLANLLLQQRAPDCGCSAVTTATLMQPYTLQQDSLLALTRYKPLADRPQIPVTMVQLQDGGLKPLTEQFRFSQRCCWDVKSSGMWHCVGGWMAADVSKDRGAKLQNRNDKAWPELSELFVLQTSDYICAYCCMSWDIPWLAERCAIVRRKLRHQHKKILTLSLNTPPVFSLSITAFRLIPCTNTVWNKSHTNLRLFGLMPYGLVHSNAHKVTAGFFLSSDPEVT
jgi:hypothetical protein